jgi:hypothetical protein
MQPVSQCGEQRYRRGGLDAVAAPPAALAQPVQASAAIPGRSPVEEAGRLQVERLLHHRVVVVVAPAVAAVTVGLAKERLAVLAALVVMLVDWGLAMELAE